MENSNQIEVKELYGVDALGFFQLRIPAFHTQDEVLVSADWAERLAERDEKLLGCRVGETKYTRMCAVKNGKIIAGMFSAPYLVHFDGHECYMSGIGDVVSDPETRRTGAVRAIFSEIFKDMRKQKQWLSHLHPFISDFYRKFGYEVSTEHTTWTIPKEFLPKADNTGIKRYIAAEEQKRDIISVINTCKRQCNMSLVYTPKQWEAFFKGIEPYTTKRFAYIHYDPQGAADGFLAYSLQDNPTEPLTFDLEHGFYFTTVKGAEALLAYLSTYATYLREVKLCLPIGIDIIRLLPETKCGNGKKFVERTLTMDGVSRVVDVEEVLKLAKYRGEGHAVIKVNDDCCDWNNHCFAVDFSEQAVAVTVDDKLAPDIEMNINAFTSMILGRYSMENWEFLPSVTVYGKEDVLSQIFYTKLLWLEEHF